jgi:hypothetical protein
MGVFGLDAKAAFEALVWVSRHANIKLNTVVDRFLTEIAALEFGEAPREELTQLLAAMSRPDGTHFT